MRHDVFVCQSVGGGANLLISPLKKYKPVCVCWGLVRGCPIIYRFPGGFGSKSFYLMRDTSPFE